MLSKELEILKHISELYKADVSDEEFEKEMQGKKTLVNEWGKAFEGYYLRDVLDAIDEYFAKKNNRTQPRIPQILALLNSNNIHSEQEKQTPVYEQAIPCYGLRFEKEDKENGDMHWFVPDYLKVEQLIRKDKWAWVQNIYNPTSEEFHRCMEEWCMEQTGHKYRFYSDNDIKKMTPEQQQQLLDKCINIVKGYTQKTGIKVINV